MKRGRAGGEARPRPCSAWHRPWQTLWEKGDGWDPRAWSQGGGTSLPPKILWSLWLQGTHEVSLAAQELTVLGKGAVLIETTPEQAGGSHWLL